eukprot:703883-Rhodomonas_salina.1
MLQPGALGTGGRHAGYRGTSPPIMLPISVCGIRLRHSVCALRRYSPLHIAVMSWGGSDCMSEAEAECVRVRAYVSASRRVRSRVSVYLRLRSRESVCTSETEVESA